MLGILGHAFLCTFLTFKVTINCVRADTTASILITSLHKTPESIQSHTLASKTRVIVFLHGEGVVELETSTIFKKSHENRWISPHNMFTLTQPHFPLSHIMLEINNISVLHKKRKTKCKCHIFLFLETVDLGGKIKEALNQRMSWSLTKSHVVQSQLLQSYSGVQKCVGKKKQNKQKPTQHNVLLLLLYINKNV